VVSDFSGVANLDTPQTNCGLLLEFLCTDAQALANSLVFWALHMIGAAVEKLFPDESRLNPQLKMLGDRKAGCVNKFTLGHVFV
jgi:hypothetical protein